MLLSQRILDYQFSLKPPFPLPGGIEWLMPYEGEETKRVMTLFYHQFYHDENSRTFILGINPGRFGAGITGVPFTDPIRLEKLGIASSFVKRQELSSVFVYEMIESLGGPASFYSRYYITSLSPLGFVLNGKNYNYYDDARLSKLIRSYIIQNIETQLAFGAKAAQVFCLGQGKNFSYLKNLNDEFQWWDRVVPLPHPRWIMQYKLKRKEDFIQLYREALGFM
jgi:uracil-DNA glycosylase